MCFSDSKKDEWGKLLLCLKEELLLLEKLAFDNKTAQLMGLNPNTSGTFRYNSGKEDRFMKGTEVNHAKTNEDPACHICDEKGHTIITTPKGNKIIPYYVCDEFVKMSPAERLSKLKSKNLCLKCLYPGAVKGTKHKCFFTYYCCPHPSHEGGEKLHIFLCDSHKKDDKNIRLLEKFKENFVDNCDVALPQWSKNLSFFSDMVGVVKEIKDDMAAYGTFRGEPNVTDSVIFQLQRMEVEGIKLNILPKIPDEVGGETDILLGIRCRKYFQKLIFELKSGLGIFESVFQSPCGARGVLGGPHKGFG